MVRVDLLDRAGLRAAFSCCDGVIHLAAPIVGDPVADKRSPPPSENLPVPTSVAKL
ncbi:hypothetical protein C2845_PM15G12000 [Panicum miliaceum]|uniref:Cinnamoyl-CoA reductase 1-like n=1 Tax=Panicum miliaceum TaxID=4540 RepID=A0A3L6Q933_PANMI|nr:hypothetical protein C2845_PM15G12000 [Panicum miliaceum]